MTSDMVSGTENKIRTIYDAVYFEGAKTLVLSAFGCGAFRNPPEQDEGMNEILTAMLGFDTTELLRSIS